MRFGDFSGKTLQIAVNQLQFRFIGVFITTFTVLNFYKVGLFWFSTYSFLYSDSYTA